MSPSARQSDSPIHKFRLTQPRKSDQINTEAWYIHSAQPSAERGYVLKEWFKPTKAQIASLKHARVARAGYWIRESAFHVRVAFKCCITNCAFCKQVSVHHSLDFAAPQSHLTDRAFETGDWSRHQSRGHRRRRHSRRFCSGIRGRGAREERGPGQPTKDRAKGQGDTTSKGKRTIGSPKGLTMMILMI